MISFEPSSCSCRGCRELGGFDVRLEGEVESVCSWAMGEVPKLRGEPTGDVRPCWVYEPESGIGMLRVAKQVTSEICFGKSRRPDEGAGR